MDRVATINMDTTQCTLAPHHSTAQHTLSAGSPTSSRAPGPLRATRFMGPTVSLKMEGGVAAVGRSLMGSVHPSILTKVMLSKRHILHTGVVGGYGGLFVMQLRTVHKGT